MARLNPRLAKIHLSYSVEEVARLYDVHKNTVRQWLKVGLKTCDDRRPTLILGRDLAEFLARRRTKRKTPCAPGEIYCVRCRVPRKPAGDMADYQPLTESMGNLIGICPICDSMIYRRVSMAKINQIRGNLAIAMPQALPHIGGSPAPSVNSDLK